MKHKEDCCIFDETVRFCCCIDEELTSSQIDDLVAEYVASGLKVSLQAYLGMLPEQYVAWKKTVRR